jgi:hypothetical protein
VAFHVKQRLPHAWPIGAQLVGLIGVCITSPANSRISRTLFAIDRSSISQRELAILEARIASVGPHMQSPRPHRLQQTRFMILGRTGGLLFPVRSPRPIGVICGMRRVDARARQQAHSSTETTSCSAHFSFKPLKGRTLDPVSVGVMFHVKHILSPRRISGWLHADSPSNHCSGNSHETVQ